MLGAIAGSIIGGLFQKSANDKARSNSMDDQLNGPSRMVSGAHKAGLNPLSLLSASSFNYGAGARGPAPLASAATVASVGASIDQQFADRKAEKAKKAEHELELEKRKLEKKSAGGSGGVVQRTVSVPGVVQMTTPGNISKDVSTPPSVMTVAPKIATPVLVMRNDGLTSANPEAPVQPEEDTWAWGREGTFLENTDEIVRRNLDGKLAPRVIRNPSNPLLDPAERLHKEHVKPFYEKTKKTLKKGKWPTKSINLGGFR